MAITYTDGTDWEANINLQVEEALCPHFDLPAAR